jgi:replicative DNA helicase
VKDRALRRRAIDAAQGLARNAFDLARPLDTGTTIEALARLGQVGAGAEPIARWASMVWDEVEKAAENPREIYGLPTGFRDLDAMTGGLDKKSLYIISGEPAAGKSLLAVQIGTNLARAGHAGAVYEMEMPGEQLARRDISARSKVLTDDMRRGKLRDDQWEPLTLAVENLAGLPVYLSDWTGWTTSGIRADCARLKALYGIEWVIIDYLFLLKDLPGASEIERTNHCSQALKAIAKDLDLVVIAINSMNKAGMWSDSDPKNASLRGSGQVAYDADDIWFLLKDEKNADLRWIYPTKARERDKLAKIGLVKLPGYPAFGDMRRP